MLDRNANEAARAPTHFCFDTCMPYGTLPQQCKSLISQTRICSDPEGSLSFFFPFFFEILSVLSAATMHLGRIARRFRKPDTNLSNGRLP
jgi:hypothetical protein